MTSLDYYNGIKDVNDMIYEMNVRIIEKVCIDLNAVDRIDELKEKYLDDAFSKIKAKRDPNKPKRPLSSYTIFCNEVRENIKKNNPKLSFSEMNKTLGEKWKQLEDKQKYIEVAQQKRQEYQEKLEEYKKENGLLF